MCGPGIFQNKCVCSPGWPPRSPQWEGGGGGARGNETNAQPRPPGQGAKHTGPPAQGADDRTARRFCNFQPGRGRQDNDRRRQTSNDQACILNPTCGRHTPAHGPKGIHEGTHERVPRARIHQERPGPGGHRSIRTKRNEQILCPFGLEPSKIFY